MTLREQREKLIADARAIQDRADAEKRAQTADELTNMRTLLAEAKALTDQITAREELAEQERLTGAPESQRTTPKKSDSPAKEQRDAYQQALRSYLRDGFAMMDPTQQKVLRAGYVPFDRIEDFATSFTKIKKVSNKGLAQVGKLPELVGSINRGPRVHRDLAGHLRQSVPGLVQQLSTLVLPTQLQNTAIFVVFLLIIFFRPQGFFGRSAERT